MKRVLFILDDASHDALRKKKDASGKTWEKFVLELAGIEEDE
jgi:hypothetical protein